ncbi:MAG: HAD-IC family P-type ATPase, partial [Pygmaiobacter sp.]
MSVILAAATLLSALLGEFTDAVTILAIVLLNAVMGFIQEYRTEKTMEALKALSAPCARVYRDGALIKLSASELVRGDCVSLTAGDRIPADGRCLAPVSLLADEALLTGESIPLAKKEGDLLYMGTTIAAGRCEMQVSTTGMQTEMGQIAGMLGDAEERRTPLQEKLDDLGKVIAVGCVLICTLVSLLGWLRGEAPLSMLLTGISLSVAAIPEGLPAIVTIVLALSVGRILKKGAVIRKLHAVETLGCAGVICSDKTGTITQNRMTVRRIYSDKRNFAITGDGLSAHGGLQLDGKPVRTESDPLLLRLFAAATLCNSASITRIGNAFSVQGDPTETALLVAAAKAGFTKAGFSARMLGEHPFDPVRKLMSVTVRKEGEDLLLCKGAPDVLLRCCNRIATASGTKPMTFAER